MAQSQLQQSFLHQLNHALFHTMKEPLRNLSCVSGLLNEQINNKDNAQLQQYTASLAANATRLSGIINGLAGLLNLESHKITKETVSLDELMLSVLDHLGKTYPQPEIQVNLNPLPTVSIDPVLMSHAFFEVLKNAQESGLGGPVKIDISAKSTDTEYHIIIKDNGAGIEKGALSKVKDLFFSQERSRDHLGLGLTKAQQIISLHGGTLSISSTPGTGTTALIKIKNK